MTVKELTQAHATIATGGPGTLHCVSKVLSPTTGLYSAKTGDERVFENDCALVIKAMEGTVQYGTGKEARSIGHTIAGKTGTANDAYTAPCRVYAAIDQHLGHVVSGRERKSAGNPDFNGYTHSGISASVLNS